MRKKKKKKKQILPKIEEIEVFRSKSTDNPSYKTIRRSEDTQTLKQNCKKVMNVEKKQKKQTQTLKQNCKKVLNAKEKQKKQIRTPWEPCGFESLTMNQESENSIPKELVVRFLTMTMTIESAERSRLLVMGKFKFYLVSGSKSTENPSYEAVRRSEGTHRTSSEPFSAKTGEKSPKNFLVDWIREVLRYEYGEAQITKDKFWNVNGTMTNKLKQDPSWSFNHSSSNVDRIGCCADTSKNYYLGNMLPKHIGSIAAKDQLTSKQNRKKVMNVRKKQKNKLSTDNPSHKTVRRSEDTHQTSWEPISAKTNQLTSKKLQKKLWM